MSKYLKSFITVFLIVCMTVCLGIFAAACTEKPNDDTNGDDNTFPSSVSVTVKLDNGTPTAHVWVQLCAVKDNGDLGLCLAPVETNTQGVATMSIDEKNGNIYEIHLTDGIPEGYQYVDSNGNNYADITVELGKAGKGMQFDVTKDASPTVTLKAVSSTTVGTEGDPLVLTAGADAVNFKVNLVKEFRPSARAEVLNWKNDYHATLTANEAGNYKITVTVSLVGDNVQIDVAPKDETVASPDTSSSTNGNDRSLTCTLLANQEYSVTLRPALEDYTNLVSSGTTSLSYSIKLEYVGEGGNDEELGEIVLGKAYVGDETIYKLTVETTANYTFTISGTDGGLFDLVVGDTIESVDNGGFGTVTFADGSTDTVELEAGTYYVIGYNSGTFTITLATAPSESDTAD